VTEEFEKLARTTEYAIQRFNEHVERFNQMADLAESGEPLNDSDSRSLSALEDQDNPFPTIDYRDFAERQGSAAVLAD